MTHTVIDGDTLETISSQNYGSPTQVKLILSANPHASGGLTPGMVLTIPPDPNNPQVTPPIVGTRENEVTLTINGKPFKFWQTMAIQRSIGRFDQFRLRSPFIPESAEYREAFRPLAFNRTQVFTGNELLFTGFNVDNVPRTNTRQITVSANGYALAAVLNDCPMPGSDFPLDYGFLNMQGIAKETAAPFGLTPVFTDAAVVRDKIFDEAAMRIDQTVLAFWHTLTKQIGLVVSNNALGQPVFETETTDPAIQLLEFGVSPVRRVDPELKPQKYFSHITAITDSFLGITGAQHTIANPFLEGVTRPSTFSAGDLLPGEEVEAALSRMGRMFANAIQYRVDVAGWRDVNGDLWRPNTKVRLLAPQAMVYTETEFLIRSVLLQRNPERDTATLVLVLPGGFSSQIPETLPWLG